MEAEAPRKRLRRRETASRPDIRFITFSCIERRALLIGHGSVGTADLFAASLERSHIKLRFELFAWVVMPEHVHLLVRPAKGQVWATLASSIKNPVAKAAIQRMRTLDVKTLQVLSELHGRARFWQPGGGFDRTVRDTGELTRAVRYIHRNPVERGLAARPEDWPWSSVRWWMGKRDGEIACDPLPGGGWERWTGYV